MAINLYKDIPAFADEEEKTINVVIDIAKGTSNKYEYDEEKGYFALDRVLHQATYYPFDYGFVPQTHAGDGDAVDVALLVTHPTFPGCVVKARPIGVIFTADQDGEDEKVIAVPVSKLDPRFDEVQTIDDLPSHVREELLSFFKEYKKLEKAKYDKIVIKGFGTKEQTYEVIKKAHEAFDSKH